MKSSYKICSENFVKIGVTLSDYLGEEKSSKDKTVVHKLKPSDPTVVDEVRVYIEMGKPDKYGVDVRWDMEIDHDDDVALDQCLIDHMSLLVDNVIFELEDNLSGVATPYLTGLVKIKKNNGIWLSSSRLGILKGQLLRIYRWAFKR